MPSGEGSSRPSRSVASLFPSPGGDAIGLPARPTCRRMFDTAFEIAPPSDAASKAPRQPSLRFLAAQWVEAAHCDPTAGVRGRGHEAVPARGSVHRRPDAVLGPGREGTRTSARRWEKGTSNGLEQSLAHPPLVLGTSAASELLRFVLWQRDRVEEHHLPTVASPVENGRHRGRDVLRVSFQRVVLLAQ